MVFNCLSADAVMQTNISSGSCDHVHHRPVQHTVRAKRVDGTGNLDPWKPHPRLHCPRPLRGHPC